MHAPVHAPVRAPVAKPGLTAWSAWPACVGGYGTLTLAVPSLLDSITSVAESTAGTDSDSGRRGGRASRGGIRNEFREAGSISGLHDLGSNSNLVEVVDSGGNSCMEGGMRPVSSLRDLSSSASVQQRLRSGYQKLRKQTQPQVCARV